MQAHGVFFRGVKLSEGNRPIITLSEEDYEDVETYLMSKSYFDLKEYDRCNFFTANCKKSPRAKFLHYYSAYLSGEKKRLDNMQDSPLTVAGSTESGPQQAKYLKHLKAELQKLHENKVTHFPQIFPLIGIIEYLPYSI